jgi:hypothetical protein
MSCVFASLPVHVAIFWYPARQGRLCAVCDGACGILDGRPEDGARRRSEANWSRTAKKKGGEHNNNMQSLHKTLRDELPKFDCNSSSSDLKWRDLEAHVKLTVPTGLYAFYAVSYEPNGTLWGLEMELNAKFKNMKLPKATIQELELDTFYQVDPDFTPLTLDQVTRIFGKLK